MSIYDVYENGLSVGSGAYAVANKAIKIKLDDFGNYQYQLSSKDDLLEVAEVCAMANSQVDESKVAAELFGGQKSVRFNELIGYYTDLYAGYVEEGDYRSSGSSGGFATWLLVELFNKKLIDGVIHVKSSQKQGVLFEYAISKNPQEIKEGAKSRYYPAEFSSVVKIALEGKERFAFVGIPSFIMEVRLLQKAIPKLKDTIIYTVGLICGHQKSAKYAECLAWQCGIKPGLLTAIDFRKKIDGAPANEYITELTGFVDGRKVVITKRQDELFASNWGHGFFKRDFSDFTDDVFNEVADISLGDAWLPEYLKDSKGNNIVIVRNEEISSLVAEAIMEGRLTLDVMDEAKIISSQAGLVHHARDEIAYRLHKKKKRGEWHPRKRVHPSDDLPFIRKRIQDLRMTIATSSHLLYKEAVEKDDFSYFVKGMRPYMLRYKLLYRIMALRSKGALWAIEGVIRKLRKRIKG